MTLTKDPGAERPDAIYMKAQALRTSGVFSPRTFATETLHLEGLDADLVEAFIKGFHRIDDEAQRAARLAIGENATIFDPSATDQQIVAEVERIMAEMKRPTSAAFIHCLNALSPEGREKVSDLLSRIRIGEPENLASEIAQSREKFVQGLSRWSRSA